MDRQAFRNRMQQLKQYREQNPGKTYFDFKAYADGGITDQRTDHPIGKPKLPDPKMIRQDRLIDLGRGDTVSDKMMKNVLNKIKGIDGMQGIFRASEQFKSIKTYTKWFNSIPLLGVGAAAVYSNNQE